VYTNFREGGRFSWRISVYDAEEGFSRAADTFSISLLAGIPSSGAIDASAERIVQNWQKSYPVQGFDGRFAVTINQRFRSRQEGVEVRFGSEDGISVGTIENGVLNAGFYPFTVGFPVYGVAMKKGYWTRPFTLPGGITEEVLELPVLQKKTRHSLGFLWGIRGINFLDMGFEYRVHIFPDRFFLKADWSLWMDDTELSHGEQALYHELRFSPGLYILPFTDSAFRVLGGTGISWVLTRGGANFLVDPLWLALEYHFPQWAVNAELRCPTIFEYSRDILNAGIFGDKIWFSLGVILKW
jgi:hypothetical protein